MRGYTLVHVGGRWWITCYRDGRAEWKQAYSSRFRARVAAWWLRVRGVKPL